MRYAILAAALLVVACDRADAAPIYWQGQDEPHYWQGFEARPLRTFLNQHPAGPGAPGWPQIDLCHFAESYQGIRQAINGKCVAAARRPVVAVPPTDQPNPIPLPAAIWLLGAALAGLGLVRRRRP